MSERNKISLYDELKITKSKKRENSYQEKYYKNVYDEIKEIYNNYKSNRKYEYEILNLNKQLLSSIELLKSSYVSTKVKSYIYNNGTHIVKYNFIIERSKYNSIDRNITINFCVFNNDVKIVDKLNNYVFKIKILLKLLFKYSTISCSKDLTLYLFLTPKIKILPEERKILDEDNVNTAVTTSCSLNGKLLIYRKEEWFKVLIHELFHVLGLDFSQVNSNMYSSILINHFNNINSNMLLSESYCEYWALILNSCFKIFFNQILSKVSGVKTKIYRLTFIKKMRENIEIERKYSLFQMTKIINYMNKNMSYIDFVNKDNISKQLIENSYREKTNVFCYYIIKTILLNNNETFMKWCRINNVNLFKFDISKKTINSFIQYIISKSTKESFIEETQIFDILYKNVLREKNNDYLMNNMRMTII